MTTYPNLRQAVGPYMTDSLEGAFDSAASAGDLWTRDIDATVAIRLAEQPFAGWVSYIAVDALGGNFSAAVFLVQVEGVAVAASSFNPGSVAAGYQLYRPTAVPFAAGDSLSVEIDSYTTFRDCHVKIGVVYSVGSVE